MYFIELTFILRLIIFQFCNVFNCQYFIKQVAHGSIVLNSDREFSSDYHNLFTAFLFHILLLNAI